MSTRVRKPTEERRLTEDDWRKVFEYRCRSKRGQLLSDEERALVDAAYTQNRKRYAAMEPDVFDATVPFGSRARARR